MRNLISSFGMLLCGLVLFAGCGMNPPQIAGPVSVNGKVVTSGGDAVGGVSLNLQPLEQGYSRTIEVKPDGTFTVETEAGKYAYFFSPKAGAKAVPPQVASLVEASLDRAVTIASGQEAVITVP